MNIDVREKGKFTIVAMSGKMTIGDGDVLLGDRFKALLEEGHQCFIFDMLGVPFLDTAGIAEVIACRKRALDREAVIKLVLRGKTHDLFTMYELDRIFDLYEDVEDALASYAA